MNLSDFHTRTNSEALGDVELKHISAADSRLISKSLSSTKDDRSLVAEILHRQLVKPNVSLPEFSALSDTDLAGIAKAFAHKEGFLEYINDSNGANFFSTFRSALRSFFDRQDQELQISLDGALKTMSSSVSDAFRKHNQAVVQAMSLKLPTQLTNGILESIGEFSNNIPTSIQKSLIVIPNHLINAVSIADAMKPIVGRYPLGIGDFSNFLKSFSSSISAARFAEDQMSQLMRTCIGMVSLDLSKLQYLAPIAAQLSHGNVDVLRSSFSGQLAIATQAAFESFKDNPNALDEVEEFVEARIQAKPGSRVHTEGILKSYHDVLVLLLMIVQVGLMLDAASSSKVQTELFKKLIEINQRIASGATGSGPHGSVGDHYRVERTVRVRARPTTKSSQLFVLPADNTVRSIERKHRWIYVEYFDHLLGATRCGWVHKKYLRKLESVTKTNTHLQQNEAGRAELIREKTMVIFERRRSAYEQLARGIN
jgi:hypothetical protein